MADSLRERAARALLALRMDPGLGYTENELEWAYEDVDAVFAVVSAECVQRSVAQRDIPKDSRRSAGFALALLAADLVPPPTPRQERDDAQ